MYEKKNEHFFVSFYLEKQKPTFLTVILQNDVDEGNCKKEGFVFSFSNSAKYFFRLNKSNEKDLEHF